MFRLLFCAIAFFIALNDLGAAPERRIPLLKEYTSVVFIGKQESASHIPVKYENNLQINKSASFRIAVRQSREDGLHQLRNLSLHGEEEEQWAFLPEENLWLELGLNESPGAAAIDFVFLKELIRRFENIEIYHIHLRSYLKSFAKGYGDIPETWLVIPSFEDIALMIYYSSYFYKYHPTGVITWNICSPLGMTDYLLTNKGVVNYMNIKEDTFLLTYFHPASSMAVNPKSISTFDISKSHEVQNLINWVNDRGKGYIRVRLSLF